MKPLSYRRRGTRLAHPEMIGLDTNVLVRYFVQDDPEQSRKARDVIERRLTEQNPGYVGVVVMAEISWVLKSVYGFADIGDCRRN